MSDAMMDMVLDAVNKFTTQTGNTPEAISCSSATLNKVLDFDSYGKERITVFGIPVIVKDECPPDIIYFVQKGF